MTVSRRQFLTTLIGVPIAAKLMPETIRPQNISLMQGAINEMPMHSTGIKSLVYLVGDSKVFQSIRREDYPKLYSAVEQSGSSAVS